MIPNSYIICCMRSISFAVIRTRSEPLRPHKLFTSVPGLLQTSCWSIQPKPRRAKFYLTHCPLEGTQHSLTGFLVLIRPLPPKNHYKETGLHLPQKPAVPQVSNWTLHLKFYLCDWGLCLPIVHSIIGGLLIVISSSIVNKMQTKKISVRQ